MSYPLSDYWHLHIMVHWRRKVNILVESCSFYQWQGQFTKESYFSHFSNHRKNFQVEHRRVWKCSKTAAQHLALHKSRRMQMFWLKKLVQMALSRHSIQVFYMTLGLQSRVFLTEFAANGGWIRNRLSDCQLKEVKRNRFSDGRTTIFAMTLGLMSHERPRQRWPLPTLFAVQDS